MPGLLNRWQVIAVAACVLFGVLAARSSCSAWQANRPAADNTEQLVRVQNIQSSLFRADALATNALPDRRARAGRAAAGVRRRDRPGAAADRRRRRGAAGRPRGAGRAQLEVVSTYTTTNTQARDNNRQGFPVGAEYLRGASTQLRADALPLIQALAAANSDRAEDELSGQTPLLMLIPGAAALALLWWLNNQQAAVFRRRFNVGLAAAVVVIGALTLIGTVGQLQPERRQRRPA